MLNYLNQPHIVHYAFLIVSLELDLAESSPIKILENPVITEMMA